MLCMNSGAEAYLSCHLRFTFKIADHRTKGFEAGVHAFLKSNRLWAFFLQ